MNSEIISSLFEQKKNSRLKKRRGVAEIISTMMLMAVTVIGALTLTYFVNDGFVSGNLGTVSALDSSLNILLLAYDTRDSSSLLSLLDVDNDLKIVNDTKGNPILCGVTCSVPPNAIPESGGTEFVVLQVQNNAIDSIFLEDITINGVVHSWDSSTSGVQLDASINAPLSGKYPTDEMFSILSVGSTPIIQSDSIQIQGGKIVNLLVKLGPADSDIQLNKGIHVFLDTGGSQPVEFLIKSGDVR